MSLNAPLLEETAKETVKRCNLQHIAVIMDGNRRWAKQKHIHTSMGHNAGVKSLKSIINSADELGIKYITVYAFSTENWGRKPEEVSFLMELLAHTIKNELSELNKNNVKIRIIGDLSRLNTSLQKILNDAEEKTIDNIGVNLQIAINYGARFELVQAMKKIAQKVKDNQIEIDDISDELVSENLYTADIPDPDLLIRTGGEQRVSNYLLWQIAYSEIYVTECLWPDFGREELEKAISEFASRERRFGKG